MKRAITILVMLTSTAAGAAVQDATEKKQLGEDRVLSQPAPGFFVDPELAVAWNRLVNDIAYAEDQFLTFKGVRAHAMMHIAMHDALNAISPVYQPFAYRHMDTFAHPIAAAAQVAHDVIVSQYPHQRASVDVELAKWISKTPDGMGRERGIQLGQQSAAAIIAARAADGWDFQGTYTFSSEPGSYQTTPPFAGFVLQPGFRFASPFGLKVQSQFRPGPPPSLGSPEYAAAYKEVKDFGRADSAVRTPEQTLYGIWWMEFAEGSVNRLARHLVIEQKLDLWRATRMFALLNMSLFDGYIATWDSKYVYNHWRPYTAVRQAGHDGNGTTQVDSGWEPLRMTPPFPEYVSAHSTVCSASFHILERTFGDNLSFTMETMTAPPEMPSRSFRSFRSAAAECADSRVQLGWHFRYSTNQGLILGQAVAGFLANEYLQPR